MKKSIVITIIAVAIVAIGAYVYFVQWNKSGTQQIAESPNVTSSAAATPIALATRFNIADFQRVSGSTVTLPLTQLFALKTTGATQDEIDENLKHDRTYLAFDALRGAKKDIIFTTSPSAGVYQHVDVEVESQPIARDGLVFLVNKDNPVKSLTKQQIVDIYSGKITNWKNVGGDDAKIIAYQRNENSGSQDGMLDLVMGKTEIDNMVTELAESMQGLVDVIANYENSKYSIGYSYYYFTDVQYIKENTKLLAINGVQPNPANFANGTYPFVAQYYVVIRADEPQNSFARRFMQLVLSDEGKAVVEEAGYVKI
ncbi:MAG: substrate-binding domain-containing protein [Clostridiales bacterium]|jgi:phosphate transport system substrate-binding protein|nr:substrate-binding domain-containing protein [Clostridiales bacterium]